MHSCLCLQRSLEVIRGRYLSMVQYHECGRIKLITCLEEQCFPMSSLPVHGPMSRKCASILWAERRDQHGSDVFRCCHYLSLSSILWAGDAGWPWSYVFKCRRYLSMVQYLESMHLSSELERRDDHGSNAFKCSPYLSMVQYLHRKRGLLVIHPLIWRG
jgi:hypothetical protein